MFRARNAQLPNTENLHTFGSLLSDLKSELVDFIRTRSQLFISELRDKPEKYKKSLIFGVVALIFGTVSFLLFTAVAAGLVAVAFSGTPFTFFWGFLIVGVCLVLMGAISGIVAYYGLTRLAPEKTVKVFRDDKAWVRAEIIGQS